MRALKPMPEGRNWHYILAEAPHATLLRNVGSVEARHDGWILQTRDGSLHVPPSTALQLLLGLRAQQLRERDPLNQPCAGTTWHVTMGGREFEVKCGSSWGGESQLCWPCEAKAQRNYPQGWSYYPGDRCRHGVYVGGCGRDLMCGRCEMGDDEEGSSSEYA